MKYKKYSKNYYEQYACICLNENFSLNLIQRKTIRKEDRPDLINIEETIGVEVTRAITSEMGREISSFNNLSSNDLDQYYLKSKKTKLPNNIKVEKNYIMLERNFSYSEIKEIIINSIKLKTEKLNEPSFHRYKKNYLCLFCDYYQEDINDAISDFYKTAYDRNKYNFYEIFVINQDELYAFSLGKLKISKKNKTI